MAKARKALKSRKTRRQSKRRKVRARKSRPRKAAKRQAPQRRRKAKRAVTKLAEGLEAIQESFEESTKMQERQGTRWGIGEG